MNRRVFATLTLTAVGMLICNSAQAITINPSEATGKDTFGYQFLPTTNLNSPPFGSLLPAGLTTTGHNTKSILEFDLTGVGVTSAQVASATLNLFVVDTVTTGFGASPSPGSPITVNLSALTGSWVESTVAWSTIPASGAQYDSLVINGINQTVSFNVTQLVKDWLDTTVTNNGLVLEGAAPVGSSPNWVYAVFASSAGNNVPSLVITPVPEPSTVVLATCALPGLAWVAMRRKNRRRK
jgi:hypothetical protein